eukprot:1536750-Pyramimonas_sp.AAC.1
MWTSDPELGPTQQVPTLLWLSSLLARGSWSTPPHLAPKEGKYHTGQLNKIQARISACLPTARWQERRKDKKAGPTQHYYPQSHRPGQNETHHPRADTAPHLNDGP